MLKHLKLDGGKIVATSSTEASILVYAAPDEAERRFLVDTLKIDEHTLNSALDPDELARLEFEPDHAALILKRPRNYSSRDNFLFRVASTGIFLFNNKIVLVTADDCQLFEGKRFLNIRSIPEIILGLLRSSISHFSGHLKVINTISDELEHEIHMAMENKHLINMFTLEKSLVYYHNAINSNGIVIDKIKTNAAKLGYSQEHIEQIDDIIIENHQNRETAQIYSNILASLMDARASIVANNLNVLMKNLNLIMIALMLPTLVVSIFSMNVPLPVPQQKLWSFWFVMVLAGISAVAVGFIWRRKKL